MNRAIHVLTVEDNAVDREAIRRLLPPAYRVTEADCLAEAVSLIRDQGVAPDCILLDLHLPDGGGLTLLEKVKALDPNVPLVILSTLDDDDTAAACVNQSAQDYLPKVELTRRLLVRVIRNAMERKQSEIQLTQQQKAMFQMRRIESIGRLAGGIAHDFNNLLCVLTGHSTFLRSTFGQLETALAGRESAHLERAQTSIREIERASERAARLTRQLLTFSSRRESNPVFVNLCDIVTAMESMLRRLIPESIAMRFELPTAPLHVLADPSQVEQVVMNLALNARDAMPDGGELLISLRELELTEPRTYPGCRVPSGRFAVLHVADTGSGMEEQVLEHIYEPFFTTKAEGKGTGLGLATVFGIVAKCSGQIVVESAPGRGTSFHLYLPAATPRPTAVTIARAELAPGLLPERVLVVEDEANVRRLLGLLLESLGASVSLCDSGLDALAMLSEAEPAFTLVMTDLVMPGMDGRDLLEEVRRRHPDVPVILLSGYQRDELAVELSESVLFLEKPVRLDTLRAVLGQVQASRRAVERESLLSPG